MIAFASKSPTRSPKFNNSTVRRSRWVAGLSRLAPEELVALTKHFDQLTAWTSRRRQLSTEPGRKELGERLGEMVLLNVPQVRAHMVRSEVVTAVNELLTMVGLSGTLGLGRVAREIASVNTDAETELEQVVCAPMRHPHRMEVSTDRLKSVRAQLERHSIQLNVAAGPAAGVLRQRMAFQKGWLDLFNHQQNSNQAFEGLHEVQEVARQYVSIYRDKLAESIFITGIDVGPTFGSMTITAQPITWGNTGRGIINGSRPFTFSTVNVIGPGVAMIGTVDHVTDETGRISFKKGPNFPYLGTVIGSVPILGSHYSALLALAVNPNDLTLFGKLIFPIGGGISIGIFGVAGHPELAQCGRFLSYPLKQVGQFAFPVTKQIQDSLQAGIDLTQNGVRGMADKFYQLVGRGEQRT